MTTITKNGTCVPGLKMVASHGFVQGALGYILLNTDTLDMYNM